MYELIDFGDNCLPSILIRKICNKQTKHLFMLGVYNFNDIIPFLQDDDYESIYKKEYLTFNENQITNFSNELDKYCTNSRIINSKYHFRYLHDFSYDISNNCITNYDFIVNQFNIKITNFKNQLVSNNTLLFINFAFYEKTNTIKIDEMIDILDKKVLSKKYFIVFFFYTNSEEVFDEKYIDKFQKYNNVKTIILKNNFSEWWKQEGDKKNILYKEIYDNFYNIMKELIRHEELVDTSNYQFLSTPH
jgi:hypothetical protein